MSKWSQRRLGCSKTSENGTVSLPFVNSAANDAVTFFTIATSAILVIMIFVIDTLFEESIAWTEIIYLQNKT